MPLSKWMKIAVVIIVVWIVLFMGERLWIAHRWGQF